MISGTLGVAATQTGFGVMPGDTPPPAWLALIVGGGIIAYCVYEVRRMRRSNDSMGSDLLRTALVFLVGVVIALYGAVLLFRT